MASLRSVFAAVLAATFFASSSEAGNIYPVRNSSFKALFGETAESIAAGFAKMDEKQAPHFTGPSGLRGSVIFSSEGFTLFVFMKGIKRTTNIGDIGGRLIVQIREGVKNTSSAQAPICFSYDMDKRARPIPAKPSVSGIEERSVRNPKSRVQPLVPDYDGFYTRNNRPKYEFSSLPDGWYASFSFSWASLYGRIPFDEGKFPVSWRLVAEYTAPDGAVSTWGTIDDPVILSWARGGDPLVNSVREAVFFNDETGPRYRGRDEYFNTRWSTYKTEKYIGYFDPGKPTFETKNPDSDDVFYTLRVKPVIDRNKNMDDVLYFNFREAVPKPKVLTLPKSYRDEIFSQLGRIYFIADEMNRLRRDYLLARYTDRPVLPPPKDETKAKPKQKKPTPGADDLLDEPDTVGTGIDLDDIKF
jgi:hypothetical protein